MLMDRTAAALPSPDCFATPFQSLRAPAGTSTNIRYLPVRRREDTPNYVPGPNERATPASDQWVDIAPRGIANRRARRADGVAAEIVQMTRHERTDIRFRAPVHLLVIVEQGVRTAGETAIEGLPRLPLRDLRRKLTFVPAGHAYHEWQEPSSLSRATYVYLDPAKLRIDPAGEALRTPRLLFEDAALWETGVKLSRLLEDGGADNACLEALGVILAHELVRALSGTRRSAPARGGLAAWQQRIVIGHIEENLSERISLAQLAALVRLSPFYFCRAFKESFGVPPRRYHTGRRIERAKELLARPDHSVTEIGMAVGFSDTSSFSSAFRRATGLTPTAYHRLRT